MARVTDVEVGLILDTDVTDFTPFISIANILVTTQLSTPAKITNSTILKEIERWLSAHFFKCSLEQQEKVHEVGSTKATFMGAGNEVGLGATLYGQQAIAMDTSGTLANMGKSIGNFRPILAISRAEDS
jgi:hypothetical protein